MTIVPLTQELLERWLGKPTERTVKGFAFLEGEEIHSIVGLFRDRPCGRWCLHCEASPKARENLQSLAGKRAVVLAVRAMEQLLEGVRGPVHVAPDTNIPRATAFLERCGFVRLGKDIYGWVR